LSCVLLTTADDIFEPKHRSGSFAVSKAASVLLYKRVVVLIDIDIITIHVFIQVKNMLPVDH